MKLIKQKVLVAAGKKYIAGEEYKRSEVPAPFHKYFDGGASVSEEPEVVIKEVPVPVFGPMTEEQLNMLNKDHLLILAVQHECEGVNARTPNDDLVAAILEAQAKVEEDGEE